MQMQGRALQTEGTASTRPEAWRVWCSLRMVCYERRELGVGSGGR